MSTPDVPAQAAPQDAGGPSEDPESVHRITWSWLDKDELWPQEPDVVACSCGDWTRDMTGMVRTEARYLHARHTIRALAADRDARDRAHEDEVAAARDHAWRAALNCAADAARGMHDPIAPGCAEWADWLDAQAKHGPAALARADRSEP